MKKFKDVTVAEMLDDIEDAVREHRRRENSQEFKYQEAMKQKRGKNA